MAEINDCPWRHAVRGRYPHPSWKTNPSLHRNRELRLVDMVVRTGISLGHFSDIENGRKEICLLNLEKLANAFGVYPADLLK